MSEKLSNTRTLFYGENRTQKAPFVRRVDEFRADPQQPLQYIVDPLGATRAIVIGGPNVPRARLEYQCRVGEQAVIAGDPNNIITPLSRSENHTCTPCTSVNDWWWLIPITVTPNDRMAIGGVLGQQISPTQRYIRVSEANRLYLTTIYGSFSYVASCS